MTTIAILTKYPTPGRSKSRMIPSLGPQGAADLSQEMLLHTIEKLCKFQSLYNHNNSNSSNNIKLCVYFDPCISKEDELEYNNDANKDICLAMKNLIKNNNVQVHCIPLQLRNKGSNLGKQVTGTQGKATAKATANLGLSKAKAKNSVVTSTSPGNNSNKYEQLLLGPEVDQNEQRIHFSG